jgi:hypothetical protein
VGKASSSKKVARASRAGGKTKVRAQQGLVFPVALGLVIAVGLALIVYARQSRPDNASVPPTLNDHWHTAYGIYACDKFLTPIQNQNDEIDGTPIGVHTHGDGVIHVHPFTSSAAGTNADLGVFFKTTGTKMSNDKLELPEGLGTYQNGDDCKGKPGTLKVLVWDDANSTANPKIFITDFGNIRFTNDRMAMTIAFVNDDADLNTLKPPSIPELDQLSDVGSTTPSTGSTTGSTGSTTEGSSGSTTQGSSGGTTQGSSGATTETTAANSATTAPATTAPAATSTSAG